ncbi:MAG TPA: diguanylate cyclase [Rhodocyclaceae bacterium]|nr:diguanylate cyclase [Rhodocyclaceae bacterium]HMV52100.1 diguanylate cyclase [Rhodocyclaceae bacterium]HMZ82927.1 diguanylate cyclase [Rhodocyclaceae bacterium]HNA02234.1 diguanylate cyclase [Rhodocyclaceae bacterium]HNB76899.1 diguanylate cyclase [Rhodocyclaceae bacterium]
MTSLDMTRFEHLKASGDLPSPKGVALAIIRLTQRSDVSLAELSRIIKTDPAFVGRLIKATNTGNQIGRRPVASVQDALSVLGLPAVRTLALGFSLLSTYRSGACRQFDYEGFWSGSLVAALAMQSLARQTRSAQPEEAFCLGLLSRIGELALATLHPDEYSKILEQMSVERGTTLAAVERNSFAMDHNELTAAMLSDWGLPKMFSDVAYHAEDREDGAFPEGSRAWLLVQALAISHHVAAICTAPDHMRSALMPRLLLLGARLQTDSETLIEMCDQVAQSWREWGALLNVATRDVPPFDDLAKAPNSPQVLPSGENMPDALVDGAANRLRVLVADDDASMRAVLNAMLTHAGHDVALTTNGREALETSLEFQPHIMITDWLMPEMNGIELIRALRQTRVGRGMYMLLLTGLGDEDKLVEAFESGVDDFMTKPLNQRVLTARLRAGQRVVRLQQEIERDREEMRRFAAELAVTNRRLHDVALTDSLTGFPNRRYAMDRLAEEWSAMRRHKRQLSVMMVDIDEFKSVNDTYGHDVGDLVLRQVSAAIREGLRGHDVVARMGGDEFIAICPDGNLQQAMACAERVRQAVAALTVRTGMLQLKSSVSVGVAEQTESMPGPDALMKIADQGLYMAKQRGRNRVATTQLGPQGVVKNGSNGQNQSQ